MASVNKATIIGNIGQDIELKKTQGGVSFINFSVATTEKFKDKQGQQQEQTEWHNISAWNRQAEVIAQYCQKGSSIYIEGKLKTESYEKDGQKKYSTKIIVREFQFIGSKQGGQQQQQSQQPQQQPQQQQQFGSSGFDVPQHQEFVNNAPQQQMNNSFGGHQ